ncbi:MAG: hypothetical protein NVS3B26_22660 [Mycobacteriales bacterium]
MNGRYCPLAGSTLRRNSRLTVAGLRPSSAAITPTPSPRRCKSPIRTRSFSDKYRAEISALGTLVTGG